MSTTKTNVGVIYKKSEDHPIKCAETTFSIFDKNKMVMTKTADKNEAYLSGETIQFTITIKNNDNLGISGINFKDTLDSSVLPFNGANYEVTSTSGTITQETNPVLITGIAVAAGGTVTITIKGIIA